MSREAALRHFKKHDAVFYRKTRAHHASLPSRLSEKRGNNELFVALISIVVSQQLGTAAADTIFKRVKKACGGRITTDSVLKTRIASLRTAGLSGAKTKTIKEIAHAVKSGRLNLQELKTISESKAAEKLMAIWGLGPWSVEMYLMFALGRADVFSVGDLGLARAMEALYSLPNGVSKERLIAISEVWAPYRTYACLLLWRTRDVNPQITKRT